MSRSFDIVIVGAGIVGAACALECARGGLKVLVLERGQIGGGTTAAGMGHIVIMDDSEAQFALTSYSRRLWRELARSLPSEVEYDECGTLWVAADDFEMGEARRKHAYFLQRGVKTDILDSATLRCSEPRLRDDLAGGLLVPEDVVVYPPCAARYFIEQAKLLGAQIRTGVRVQGLLEAGGVLLSDGSCISAARSVNATGPWAPDLSPGLPVRKRKGHLLITDRFPGFVRHQLVELGYLKSAHSVGKDSVAFNIQPRKNGQMLIGSSRQFDADDTQVEHGILERMLERALQYLPTLGDLSSIRAWTGHRAATPDKLPIIGPMPDNDHVWLATGHEGLGIATSLATGRLLADMILQRKTEIPTTPYSPARFAARQGNTGRPHG